MSENSIRRIARARRLTPLIAAIALLCSGDRMHAAVPTDFNDTLVASVGSPTAIAFTPDGRLLITTQTGALYVVQGGTLLSPPALALGSRVCTNSERGVLGVAVDPGFSSNGFVYLYYTSNTSGCVNRVSRFMLSTGNVIDPLTELVLIDNIPSTGGNHNAGDVQFGKDGYLYISVGDGGTDYNGDSGSGGQNNASRDQNILLGKILRITSAGGIPPSNPFQGNGTARCNVTGRTTPGLKCQETYAWGLRNPFRMAFDPNAIDTRFFINDVGQDAWEEIDLGSAGADYGWNVREGHCAGGSTTDCGTPPSGMTNPVYDYAHAGGCTAITGGAFVPNGVWPSTYNGTYLFADYVCGTIFTLTPGPTYTASTFATNLGGSSAVAMTFGPYLGTQALYYTSYAGGGQVRRIAYTGSANRSPVAVATATPSAGLTPLTVTFDGSSSSDPDSNPITYDWDFGDGTPHANTATAPHTYTAPAVYTATLTVRDNLGASGTATVRIDAGNTPPVPTIVSPSISDRFRVGQTMTLEGNATDLQEGLLADSRLTWTVLRHHDTHTHPFLPPTTGNNLVFTMPPPEDFLAAGNSYLEILLTATDQQGLAATVSQDLRPNMVNVSFDSVPAGLRLDVNGTVLAGQSVGSWEGYVLNANARTQKDSNGQWWAFGSWSDGGTATHAIATPASAATYVATFAPDATAPAGLIAQYYNEPVAGVHFGALAYTRTDATINFDWAGGAPGTGVSSDNFSVRWTGQVHAPVTGDYTFSTTSDDGVRLWVNGQLLIDNWTEHAPATNSAVIALLGDIRYDVKLEYYEKAGGAVAKLLWAYPGQAQQIIPQTRLYPVSTVANAANQGPTANAGADQTITLPNTATLTGIATDDGLPIPPGVLTYSWAPVGGPGTVTFSAPSALSTTATFSAAGTYTLRLTVSDGAIPASDDVVITVNPVPPPGTTGTGLTGQYFSDPGTGAHFGTLALTRTDATVNFDWVNAAPAAGMSADNFSVRWTGQVAAPVAGTYTFSTTSDDGVRLWVNGQLLIDNWTDHAAVTNSGTIALAGGVKYDVKLEFYEKAGQASAKLLWAYPGQTQQIIPQAQLYPPGSDVVNGAGTGTNQGPTANAGADQTITLPNTATLTGSATDDGLPIPPGVLTYSWAPVGSPSTVTFSAPYALSTTATFSAAGTYTLRLTVSDGAIPASDDVVITVNPVPPPGTTGTGLTGQYFSDPGTGAHFGTLALTRTDATINFDWVNAAPAAGMSADNFSVRWTGQVAAPVAGTYTFSTTSDDGVRLWVNGQLLIDNWTDHAAVTNSGTIALAGGGVKYDVKLEYYEKGGQAVAKLLWAYPGQAQQIIPQAQLYPPSGLPNQGPTVNAGADQAVTLPNTAALVGTAGDDGQPNPPGTLSTSWSAVSGPGTVAFSTPTALSTTASFSVAGTYTLRLTATDGAIPASDDIVITVNPVPGTTGTGLTGQYYNDPGTGTRFTTLALTRTDATVNFNWVNGSPATGISVDNFSVRWTGQVAAPVSGTYTFSTTSDDGVRLWVNGQLLIDNWTIHAATTNSAVIALAGGVRYDVKLEFYESGGQATARLLWAYPGQAQQVIPQAQLYP